MRDTVSESDSTRAEKFRELTDPWSVPLFRLRGRSIHVSYSVFLVAAAVLGVALNEALRGSFNEVVNALTIGVLFWLSGWVIQSAAFTVIGRLVGSPINRLSLAPFGVKTFPRAWSPSSALAVSLGTIASLILLGTLYRVIAGDFPIPMPASEPGSIWTPPSIGLTKHDSPWLAGAWLCWIQAIFQMFPLNNSIGRQLLGSLIALSAKHRGVDFRLRVLRGSLAVIAIATTGFAIRLYFAGSFPGWLIVLATGVSIWISSRDKNMAGMFLGFQQHAEQIGPIGLRATAKKLIRTRQGRKRSKLALRREHEEAVDASRLDEVLNRLHEGGADSLSREDRELLQRVSERVRKERDGDSANG